MSSKNGSGMKIALIIVAANLLLGIVTYPMMPDEIIMHWGAGGVPDGFGPKLTGVLLMQLIQFIIERRINDNHADRIFRRPAVTAPGDLVAAARQPGGKAG